MAKQSLADLERRYAVATPVNDRAVRAGQLTSYGSERAGSEGNQTHDDQPDITLV
jgi:hypothetical protein